jgi:hypothetical protein
MALTGTPHRDAGEEDTSKKWWRAAGEMAYAEDVPHRRRRGRGRRREGAEGEGGPGRSSA